MLSEIGGYLLEQVKGKLEDKLDDKIVERQELNELNKIFEEIDNTIIETVENTFKEKYLKEIVQEYIMQDKSILNDSISIISDSDIKNFIDSFYVGKDYLVKVEREKINKCLLRYVALLDKGIKELLSTGEKMVIRQLNNLGTKVEKTNSMVKEIGEIVEKIVSQPLESKEKIKDYNIPQETQIFTGRQKEVLYVTNALNTSGKVVICGIGGMGKTQIAKDYLYKNKSVYNEVYWINAKSMAKLENEYIEFAEYYNLIPENREVSNEWIKKQVIAHMQSMEHSLLILDNVDRISINSLRQYFPQRNVDIIITTQDSTWDKNEFDILQLKEFDIEDAKKFMLNYCDERKKEINEVETIEELVKMLKLYPLALEYSRAYINRHRISYGDYIRLYYQNAEKVLYDPKKKISEYEYTIITTWDISFNKCLEIEEKCYDFMGRCALLDNNSIPKKELFIDNNVYNEVDLEDIIESLMTYSLIDTKVDSISMHSITQQLMRMELKKRGEYTKYICEDIQTINDTLPIEIISSSDKDKTLLIYNHFISLVDIAMQEEFFEELPLMILKAGEDFYNLGRYDEANMYIDKVLEKYNDRIDPSIHIGLVNLQGLTYYYSSRQDIAQEKYLLALHLLEDKREKISFDNRCKLYCNVSGNLGILYKQANQWDKSLFYYNESLNAARKINDKEFECTQLMNIGVLYKNQGQYDKAMDYYEKASKSCTTNKLAAKILANKGSILQEEKNFEAACLCFEQTLDTFTQIGDLRSLSISFDHLGTCYKYLQQYKVSYDRYMQALKIAKDIGYKLGEAITLSNLALLYLCTNDLKLAKENFEKAFDLSVDIGFTKCMEMCKFYLEKINFG